MPFTTPEARKITDTLGPQVVGDRCFIAYRPMIQKWRKSLRWTTAHEIYKEYQLERFKLINSFPEPNSGHDDKVIALDLAWQVFFALDVLPYEQLKRMENGEVL